MSFYAIALIIDDSVKVGDLNKATSVANNITSLLDVRTEENGLTYYVLKNVTPEIKAKVYMAITRKVPIGVKNKIQGTEEQNGIVLPSPIVFWLDDGIDYSREEIERRLKLWSKEDGASHIWILDINSDLTGDILSKFSLI